MAKKPFSELELIAILKRYKKKLEDMDIPVQKIYLYGSYVKGTAHFDSDIDICVISPSFTDKVDATMTLMKLRDDSELDLSPVAFLPQNFVDENPLAYEIRLTGRAMSF